MTRKPRDAGVAIQQLVTRRIEVTRRDLPTVTSLPHSLELDVIVSRIEHRGTLYIPEPGDTALVGDIISVVGTEEEVQRAEELIGEGLPGDPTHDDGLDFRRIFVSSPEMVGVPLAQLRSRLDGMLVTRVRRGDADMVATPDTVLQLGDRVRVVAEHDRLDRATRLFGDSYKRISDFNLLPLLAGLALGVIVGMIPIPLPGGTALKLGNAGGPLLVALILGAKGRTGPIVWQVPYGANLCSAAVRYHRLSGRVLALQRALVWQSTAGSGIADHYRNWCGADLPGQPAHAHRGPQTDEDSVWPGLRHDCGHANPSGGAELCIGSDQK